MYLKIIPKNPWNFGLEGIVPSQFLEKNIFSVSAEHSVGFIWKKNYLTRLCVSNGFPISHLMLLKQSQHGLSGYNPTRRRNMIIQQRNLYGIANTCHKEPWGHAWELILKVLDHRMCTVNLDQWDFIDISTLLI